MSSQAEQMPVELPRMLAANPELARWISVAGDGSVSVRTGKAELGQGISTAMAQIAADALGMPVDGIRMVPAHTTGPDTGITAGSMSVADAGSALRGAARRVRSLFRSAAATRLGCEVDTVVIVGGRFATADGRSVGYGELAGEVDLAVLADEVDPGPDVPPDVPVEDDAAAVGHAAVGVVGTDVPRLDLPGKIRGEPAYVTDLRLPDLLVGRVLRPPSPSGRLVGLDDPVVPGGVHVVQDGSFVGVVGQDEVTVERGLEALAAAASWEEHDNLPDEDDLDTFLRAGPHEDVVLVDDDPSSVATGQPMQASYSRPFLAHGSIAPSAAAACWRADGSLQVWTHSQGIFRLQSSIAQVLGLEAQAVDVQHVQNAGCYGHNGADDAAFDAVLLARSVPGSPVLVRWSRQDELAWSPLGSAMVADITARVDVDGRLLCWTSDIFSQGHTARPGYAGVPGLLAAGHLADPVDQPAAADPPVAAGAGTLRNALPGYDVGPRRITGHRLLRSPIRSSAIRSLGAFLNVFAIESFMDEVALAHGVDPVRQRLDHLDDDRARAVLLRAAEAADWGAPLPEGLGRGVAVARYKGRGGYCAAVAEVEAETDIRVRRLVLVVDVGRVVNPDGVRNQIEGGATQATSWTLKERVRFDRRRIVSVDWETYPILRFSEAPAIDVHLLDRPDEPSVGAGECAQGPTAAAIGNAVAAAVGVRVRDLPITPEAVVAAIEAEG